MRTKASVAGHPLHPILVVVPLGALPTALVFDALHAWSGEPAWWRAALVASAVGAAGLVAAIVPALVDFAWSVPKRGAVFAVAKAHMALGLSLTVLFAASVLLRWAVPAPPSAWAAWSALLLNALGNVGLVVQGFLGGELRAKHQLGVDTRGQDVAAVESAGEDARTAARAARRARGSP